MALGIVDWMKQNGQDSSFGKAGRAVRNSGVHRNGSSEQSAPGKPSGEDAGATECTAEYTENRDVSENKDGVHPLKDCHRLPE